jgi:2-oxo-3-hexenedioate decarboxylase
MAITPTQREDLATELLAAQDAAHLLPLPSARHEGFDLDDAFAAADAVATRRRARGEVSVGFKIGFTNRSLWDRYGVHAPIWGPVWRHGVRHLEGAAGHLSLAGLVQPRLEPEIVFGFARAPEPGSGLPALVDALAWVAHGFEVVHTHYEGWRFTAPDTVADAALHGRLLIGPRVPVAGWANLAGALGALRLSLLEGDGVRDEGAGHLVLDGPLQALQLWLAAMARQAPRWAVQPGDIVTTGTLTDAWPLQPGQRWHTRLSDERLAGLSLTIEA